MTVIARPHVWRPGDGQPPLLLLHGTGGDEHDLIGLGQALRPGAPLLSPRGEVSENGTLRHFRRLREGVFDEDDLRRRTDDLAAFVAAAGETYGVATGSWCAVGFSNGANIASALLLGHPELLAGAVLMSAMIPFRVWPAADLSGRWVVVANGARDPLAPPRIAADLAAGLRERGADAIELPHPGGHAIDRDVVDGVARLLSERSGRAG